MNGKFDGAVRADVCERCGQQPIGEDGLCQTCYLIVVQDPKYRPTQGELVEDKLSGRIRETHGARAGWFICQNRGAR